jgi:PTS system cellobiose-specific IIA component
MDINQIAMTVIMNSCNGRDKVDECYKAIYEDDFTKAKKLLDEANDEILKAHRAQTEVIQAQAAGEDMEYSLLFIHAQDTLMTSDSQLRTAQSILPIFMKQNQQKRKSDE